MGPRSQGKIQPFEQVAQDRFSLWPRDFLKKRAQTPLSRCFCAAGILCRLSTNFRPILEFARQSFIERDRGQRFADFRVRLWVDLNASCTRPWPKPYYRGLGHLIFAGFDSANSLLIDLRSRRVFGRFTPSVASDRTYWRSTIFPVLVSILAASAGGTVLHCASVEWDGKALLLAGKSGSGKSTLSLALSQAGLAFLSDDRTCVSLKMGRLLASPLVTILKLRPDAPQHFPELVGLEPGFVSNGEKVFMVAPEGRCRVSQIRCCEPRWIVFLERETAAGFRLTPIGSEEAAARLEEGLAQDTPTVMELERRTIRILAQCQCWVLRYGGEPHAIARALVRFLSEHAGERKSRCLSRTKGTRETTKTRWDPLRRFTPTPLVADLPVMERTLRLETNSPVVLEQARRAFARYAHACPGPPQFVWRIVAEPNAPLKPPWPERSAFSDAGLRFVSLGPRCFLALDLESREAIGFVPEDSVRDDVGFSTVFLGTLFYLTSGALRLTPVSAACVALGRNGLLLFGPPNSGKTTSGYLSSKLGMEFFADQAIFAELEGGRVIAWGEFWPGAFRPQAVRFQPELAEVARSFEQQGFTFLCVGQNWPNQAHCVIPSSCLFLERGVAEAPQVIPLSACDFAKRLRESIPFQDDNQFEADQAAVFGALSQLPAYRLLYGDDPGAITPLLRTILQTQNLVEAPA